MPSTTLRTITIVSFMLTTLLLSGCGGGGSSSSDDSTETPSLSIANTQAIDSLNLVEVNGIEPMTSCVQGRRSPN